MGRNDNDAKLKIHAEAMKDLGERDSDHRPSNRPMRIRDEGKLLRFQLDAVGEYFMEMIVDSDHKTGRVNYRGMRLCRSMK